MIDKQYGKYILICDSCNIEEVCEDFSEAVEFIQDNYWYSEKIGGDWINYCPHCNAERIKSDGYK